MFSQHVADKLKSYVYRLIDPRNGETFYVGKGTGNRVFDHAKGEPSATVDDLDEKLSRIREIRLDWFEVAHVIHRHGMTSDQAFEVEAALIDAYPEVTNQIGGRSSGERGLMHADQIIRRDEAPMAVFKHKLVLININRSATERESVYEAVRYAWKLNLERAAKAEYVLAVRQGLIVGAFIADKWLEATTHNFPRLAVDLPGRRGFVGHEAPETVSNEYKGRRVPRKRGEANPVLYIG